MILLRLVSGGALMAVALRGAYQEAPLVLGALRVALGYVGA